MQVSAYTDNRTLTRPRRGIAYTRLRETKPQAQVAAEFLREKYADPNDLVLSVGALLDDLSPSTDPAAVPRFEQAMKAVALHLGMVAQRPEQEVGKGPDVLWGLGEAKFWVIECKSGSQQKAIPKSDMAQLSHSMNWFAEAYGDSCSATPVLVHPTRDLDRRASAGAATRILTFAKLEGLREAVKRFAQAVATHRPYCDSAGIWERLTEAGLNAGGLEDRWTVAPRSGH